MEIQITYNGGPNHRLDKKIIAFIEQHGFKLAHQGYSFGHERAVLRFEVKEGDYDGALAWLTGNQGRVVMGPLSERNQPMV